MPCIRTAGIQMVDFSKFDSALLITVRFVLDMTCFLPHLVSPEIVTASLPVQCLEFCILFNYIPQ